MNKGEDAVEQQAQPALCVKCNSFFSNAACNDLCSKCHRELESSQAKTAAAGAAIEALVRGGTSLSLEAPACAATTSTPSSAPAAVSSATPPPPGDGSTPPKAGPSRCHECRKKVGLTGFKCKCGELFCGQHRYAESHACGFDHKGVGRAKLAEANPLVMAKKVQQI